MFGFLRLSASNSSNDWRKYRQTYASLCSWQRQTFGLRASILISYEAVFLYQLAVDSRLVNQLSSRTPTCCRLRNDSTNQWRIHPEAANFATAFALLLAKTKLEDDVRDSGSLLPRIGSQFWRKATDAAVAYFADTSPDLVSSVECLIEEHVLMENSNFQGSFDDYGVPTANAFGLVFEAFAGRLSDSTQENFSATQSSSEVRNRFRDLGRLIGKGILLADCVFDYHRDRRSGSFNPISNHGLRTDYQRAAAKAFADAGWITESLSPDTSSVTCQILSHAFRRIAEFQLDSVESKPLNNRSTPNRFSPLQTRFNTRTGHCDIPCECGGCEACGECGGCETCGGVDTDSPPCNDCCFSFALCDPFPAKEKPTRLKINIPTLDDSPDDLIGTIAITDCILNPTGYIEIDGKRHPAKTSGQFCEAGQQVKLVSWTSFGFLVEPISAPPSN